LKVLFSLDNYDHGTGGAEKVAQALARNLAASGHEVRVLQIGEAAEREDRGVAVIGRPPMGGGIFPERNLTLLRQNAHWERYLAEEIRSRKPDMVVTQNYLAPATVQVARDIGIPSVVLFHGYSSVCPIHFVGIDPLAGCDLVCLKCLSLGQKLRYRFIRKLAEAGRWALRSASLAIANSRYTRDVLGKLFDVRAEVLYPTMDLPEYRLGGGGDLAPERILFSKPQQIKGVRIFLDVAAGMPEARFVVAGKASRRIASALRGLKNVEHLGWVGDMRELYRGVSAVVGPSRLPEPFGRVFAEAAVNGIPSVASRTGGIPEAVGEGGILLASDEKPERWMEALRLVTDRERREEYSRKALDGAERLIEEGSYGRFREIAHSRLGLEV